MASPLSPLALKAWMDEKRAFVLFDTASADRFMLVHLPEACNACVYEIAFLDHVAQAVSVDYEPDKPLVVYGPGGDTKNHEAAANKLERRGFTRVHYLEGGLRAWRAAGFALEGERPDTPDEPGTWLTLEPRTYHAVTQDSRLLWAGRNPNTKHVGSVKLARAQFTMEEGGCITGIFEIDMRKMENFNLEDATMREVLLAHLASDDFFFIDEYPYAVYTLMAAQPVPGAAPGSPNVRLSGVLALRGVNGRLDVDAILAPLEDGRVALLAHFDLDRTQWNVVYGSGRFFEHLGMHLVFDAISIELRIVFE